MLRILMLVVTVVITANAHAFDHGDWDVLLGKHVRTDGRVDYAGMAEDRARLDRYVHSLAEARPFDWPEAEAKAFWINAYNAIMIKLVVDEYPVSSVLKIDRLLKFIPTGGVFHRKVRVAGSERSLSTIEHRILRARYGDPRIHAAINCASLSCPVLMPMAYRGHNLDETLDTVMTRFLLDRQRNQLTVDPPRLSQIFKWFGGDFEADHGSVWAYVRAAVPEHVRRQLAEDARPGFLPYDWSLNDVERP